ncbi:hypothetical protein LCGC14_1702450 [marine sediment metagenome]|uniref:Uncharacterized protein n=1 Tax=marine sediment metagenome TaxID=412755 RepID=A0A0F9KHK8_9ZZZZ
MKQTYRPSITPYDSCPLKCERTGNKVGTDTVTPGQLCPCKMCQAYTLGLIAGQIEQREKDCAIIRKKCIACDNGIFGIDKTGDAIECEYCGRPIAALKSVILKSTD